MILSSLPDLPPRPETAANAAFRRQFYARWGRENAVVCGRSVHAEYAAIAQTLSIKMTLGGREHYQLPHRELVVDDDNLLVLNEGQRYGSVLSASRAAWSFSVFFRPGMQREVAAQQRRSVQAALDQPDAEPSCVEFAEHLRPHRGEVSLRLKRLAQHIEAGERSEAWLEEQLTFLLADMLAEERAYHKPRAEQAPRRAQRHELHRRLRLAVDLIESHYTDALNLERLASEACLSRFHFLREFTRLTGESPHDYLSRKRARVAQRMIARGEADATGVALSCGFANAWALKRALAKHHPAEAEASHPPQFAQDLLA